MKIFRIKIYLKIKIFIKALFHNKINLKKIDNIILKQSNKNFLTYTSQLRSAFLLVLKYLKLKYKNKNEIVLMSYNLKEMTNIPLKLNLKINFCDIDFKTGSFNLKELQSKINNKTLCVVLTNIFSNYESCKKIKHICIRNKVPLIEDNAIYFDNFAKKKKKIYSGSFGDYSLLSFNIMKNISGLYGGCISYNNLEFKNYCNKLFKKKSKFPSLLYTRQIIIFFVLKVLSLNLLYKYFFHYLFYFASEYKINLVQNLIYPSLRFKNSKIPSYYLSPMSNFTKKLIYYQLEDFSSRKKNHETRKINNKYYYYRLNKINSKNIFIFPVLDFNFQNYLEFPVFFKEKKKIHKFLMQKGFDLKKIHYFNCSKEFKTKFKCVNSQRAENEILCLPNHNKINKYYIDRLINEIEIFYKNNKPLI